MYINGGWTETSENMEVVNPANQQVYKTVYSGDSSHAQEAIQAADKAFSAWASLPAKERAVYLEKVTEKLEEKKEILAQTITLEMGKAIRHARYEVASTISFFKWFAEEARRTYGETIPSPAKNKRLMEIKQPVGVVAAITPWNFPLFMGARKLAPALAAGCTVILRPSNASPCSALELFKVFEECNFPDGVVNLVIGPANEIADTLMESPKVKKISFTGSTEVGKDLIKKSAETLKRVSMELGGHAPLIVFNDADLDLAVDGAIRGKFVSAGQQCISANRIYVQDEVYDDFTNRYLEKIKELKVLDGIDEASEVGPLINRSAITKVHEHVEDAVASGATLVYGGQELTDESYNNGNFYQPTLLTDVNESMKIAHEETFGPVAPIFRFTTEEEVIQKANDTVYGLAAYFYTNDLSRSYYMMENLDYGMVGINDTTPFTVEGSFGGMKESGLGREGGHGINEYLEKKFVSTLIR